MKIGLACGGTGGHTFPGLATAAVFKDRGHEVTLWLAGKDIESASVKDWDGPSYTIYAEGFQHGISLRSVQTARQLFEAYKQCKKIMRDDRPDVMLGMGSYASVGPVAAALKLKIPVALHEANVYPGRTVSLFSKRATAVAASFEETRHYMRGVDLTVTGMPLRKQIELAARANVNFHTTDHRFTILSMGGSRGSRPLNEIVSHGVLQLQKIRPNFHVIHLTGQADEERIRARYHEAGISCEVKSFVHDMTRVYAETDLAICRAGAATCAELSSFGIPALLIPYPYAARDHQTANAQAMERIGCADFVPESDLEALWLAEYLEGCMNTPARMTRMSKAARNRSRMNAAEGLAELVLEAAESRQASLAS
ncbi:MAG: UDP-N-acetylglucosamine--N-acetylmuramyl-(pentapeptide) pyrophosphoryl-undecaprenol N-acetylglucosamine transferase [Kiritimatiellia bacterium]